MNASRTILPELKRLRKKLHQSAELSNQEARTAEIVTDFLQRHGQPHKLINQVGGHGVLAVYEGTGKGPTLAFRCELDALPIDEKNRFAHRSARKGVSHKCGHDGHMTMLAGLGALLSRRLPARGRVLLIFQPAEETGQGARRMLQDSKFRSFKPDFFFALHNLPGYPRNRVVLRDGVFACASRGMVLRLHGMPAHAAHPEHGHSPALALAQIIEDMAQLPVGDDASEDFTLATVVYARLGEAAFGTAPADAELRATLRACSDEALATFSRQVEKIAKTIIINQRLHCEISWQDEFAASVNDDKAVEMVASAVKSCGLEIHHRSRPFRWSEDFGQFTKVSSGALFGLGAGVDYPALHSQDYDFPDALIRPGVRLFERIVRNELD